MGAHTPRTRELDSETVARARLFAESRAVMLAEAGDVLLTWREWQVLSLVDGERDPSAIAVAATISEDAVRRALAELAAHGLVARSG